VFLWHEQSNNSFTKKCSHKLKKVVSVYLPCVVSCVGFKTNPEPKDLIKNPSLMWKPKSKKKKKKSFTLWKKKIAPCLVPDRFSNVGKPKNLQIPVGFIIFLLIRYVS